MGIQESFGRLAKDPRMTFEARRVLDFCLSRMGFENHIHIPQEEIARELTMKQPSVSRALRLLVEISILLEGPKIGRSKSYRLNSNYGWKGKIHNLTDRRHEERKRSKANEVKFTTIYAVPIADHPAFRPPDGETPPDASKLNAWEDNHVDEVTRVLRKNPAEDEVLAFVLFSNGIAGEIMSWMGDEPLMRVLSERETVSVFGRDEN
jgi:hypothetical protein